jgi:hypothetical protein
MVSSFYNITEFFNRISLAHPNVTTFTFGNLDDIDLAKQTQFPLAHLIINNVEVASGKITYDVSYMVMDKVANITPESTGKNNSLVKDYIGVDNSIDVWNSSLETINNIYSYIQRNPDNLDYDIDGDAVLTPFKDRFDNLLAGWGADFSITVGNENNICVLDPMSLEYVLPAIDMARVSVSASYAQTSSFAITASYFSGSIEDALRSISSSYSLTSSFSLTASYWSGSIISASFALRTDTASYALHAGNSMSASWASSSVSASQAETASYAYTASYISGGVELPATYSQAYTASIVTSSTAQYNIRIDDNQTNVIYNDADYSNYSYLTVSKSYTALVMNSASVYTAVEASNQYSNPNVTIASADFNTGKQSVASFTTESISLGVNGLVNIANITIKPEAIQLNGPVTASSIRATAGFTGSLDGTASFALTASFITASGFLTTGSNSSAQQLSGSLGITGSITITGSNIFGGAGYRNTSILRGDNNFSNLNISTEAVTSGSVGQLTNYLAQMTFGRPGFTTTINSFENSRSISINNNSTAAVLSATSASVNTGTVSVTHTGVLISGRGLNITAAVTASSVRATEGFTGSLDGTASQAYTSSYFNGPSAIVGIDNTASGIYNFIAGQTSKASGYAAISIGSVNKSDGNSSITIGSFLSSSVQQQLVLGNYNQSSSAEIVIGRGINEANRSNAIEIYDTKTVISGTLEVSGTFIGNISSASYASNSLSASYAVTTSYAYDMEIANKLVVKGVLSASIFYADSASIVFTSGSNNFGNAITDLQILSGSVIITGSLSTTSPAYLSNITGSLYGTASQALTASYVDLPATYSQAYTSSYSHTASYVALPATYSQAYTSSYSHTASYVALPVTYSQAYTASYSHTASYVELPTTYSQAFTASYIQNAQFATSSLTASYALTASYISGSAGVGFPFTGSAVISGTLYVSNSSQGTNVFATASNSVSSSYTLTASLLAGTASQAFTSSYVINAQFATASLSSSYASSSLSSSYASSSLSSSYASSSLTASYVSSSQFINATSSANLVSNITDTYTGTTAITNIITLTQAEYDAITTKSSSTVYYII